MLNFGTDTEWPQGVLKHFRGLEAQAGLESRYYGPYDFLLNYVTEYSEDYEIAPQTSVVGRGHDAVDFVMWYVVRDSNKRIVLLLEVKDDSWIERPSTRLGADDQMRERIDGLIDNSSLNPRVYGISVLGTRAAVYVLDTRSSDVRPKRADRGDTSRALARDFLAQHWSLDILSQAGFDRVKDIMRDISVMSKSNVGEVA